MLILVAEVPTTNEVSSIFGIVWTGSKLKTDTEDHRIGFKPELFGCALSLMHSTFDLKMILQNPSVSEFAKKRGRSVYGNQGE